MYYMASMHWGDYQKECHRLLDEVFLSKAEGYKWLRDTFSVYHFSELDRRKDADKLREIYNKLYVLSFKTLDDN